MEYVAHELGVPVVHLPALQRELSLAGRRDRGARALRTVDHAAQADVLHTHTAKAGATGRIAARLSGADAGRGRPCTRSTATSSRATSAPRRERVFIQVERLLARRTGAIIAVSDEVRDDLVRLGVAPPEKIVVIPYGFDLSELTAPGRRASGPSGEAAIGVPARRLRRRLGRTADADQAAARSRPDARGARRTAAPTRTSSCVGDGPERASVEQLAGELGVRDRCRFLGYRRDMSRWYGTFDAFLLTSENEGTPVVAIEALASGCPVVATNAGGTATVVRDGDLRLPGADRRHARARRPPRTSSRRRRARPLARRGPARVDVRARFASEAHGRRRRRALPGAARPSHEGPPHPQDQGSQRLRAAPADAPARPCGARGSTRAFLGLDVPGTDAPRFYRELEAVGVPAEHVRCTHRLESADGGRCRHGRPPHEARSSPHAPRARRHLRLDRGERRAACRSSPRATTTTATCSAPSATSTGCSHAAPAGSSRSRTPYATSSHAPASRARSC